MKMVDLVRHVKLKRRAKQCGVMLCICWCLLFAACNGVLQKSRELLSYTSLQDPVPTVAEVKSDLQEKASSSKVNVTNLAGADNISTAQFVSETNGWVGTSDGAVYRTSDSGQTWQRVKLDLPSADIYLSAIYFADESRGWIAIQTYNPDFLRPDRNELDLLYTGDGGRSWQAQYRSNAANIQRIKFVNDREGWAVGSRRVQRSTLQNIFFILRTTDGGKNWIEVSDRLNSLVADWQGNVQDSVTDIYAGDVAKATVLTGRRLFSTKDGGQSWEQIATIPNEAPQTSFTHVGFKANGQLRILGGTDSREGMWSVLAQQEDHSWIKYRVEAHLRDVAYLSDAQILACGSIRSDQKDSQRDENSDGVILYSSNGGRNWTIIFRSRETSKFNTLTVVDNKRIWVTGQRGLIVSLAVSDIE